MPNAWAFIDEFLATNGTKSRDGELSKIFSAQGDVIKFLENAVKTGFLKKIEVVHYYKPAEIFIDNVLAAALVRFDYVDLVVGDGDNKLSIFKDFNAGSFAIGRGFGNKLVLQSGAVHMNEDELFNHIIAHSINCANKNDIAKRKLTNSLEMMSNLG